MVTVEQYAWLSNEVYRSGGGSPGTGWETFRISSPNSSGYYAVAYRNLSTNEIVIAHRGTQLTDGGDLKSDWQIFLGGVPNQVSDANAFYQEVFDQVNTLGLQVSSYSHTGHSLGAAIAREVSADLGQAATIFNAPGYTTVPAGKDFSRLTVINAADGFAALVDQDTNADGQVNANDANFANLRLWQDLNQNGISEAGELFTLNQKGIASIHVAKTENNTLLPNGNVLADVDLIATSIPWTYRQSGENVKRLAAYSLM